MRVGQRLLGRPDLYFAILLHPEWTPRVALAGVSTSNYQAFLSSETFQFVAAVLNPFGPDGENEISTVTLCSYAGYGSPEYPIDRPFFIRCLVWSNILGKLESLENNKLGSVLSFVCFYRDILNQII